MEKEFTSNICKKCSNVLGDCCSEYQAIPLTRKDIIRITAKGHKPGYFVVAEKYSTEDLSGTEAWWKNSFYKKNKVFYRLCMRKTKQGKCIFLNRGKGCRLGRFRPFVCRIFPFWVYNRKIKYEAGERAECLIGIIGCSVDKGIKLIKENKRAIKKYYDEIKDDCIKPKKNMVMIERIIVKAR